MEEEFRLIEGEIPCLEVGEVELEDEVNLRFRQRVEELAATVPSLIIDLRRLRIMSEEGAGSLGIFYKKYRQRVAYVQPLQPEPCRRLEFTRLIRILALHPDVESAEAFLRGQAS